jgi:hypothetical protein
MCLGEKENRKMSGNRTKILTLKIWSDLPLCSRSAMVKAAL